MKVELLAPAGDMESLRAAVMYGADACYIAFKKYGARKFAKNFTFEEIDTAIKFCHLYGVKLYVTVNTLVYENEVDDFLECISKLHSMGVDAVIMQDLGMIDLVHKMFPNLVIHASTQCDNHNREKLELLKNLGVKRAVLAREMSIDEIKKLDVDIEKEVFIHGAMCVSYSGLCYFSSSILNRSGNKGECAGMCRLPYSLYENGKKCNLGGDYIFSMKDLGGFSYLKELLDSNVTALKIEGRMKSSYYVGFVTFLYRKLIDEYYKTSLVKITDEDLEKLKKLYYRGFCSGYLKEDNYKNLVSFDSPNHKGVLLGKVLDISSKIKIKLACDLNQNDGIRFSNNEGMIVNYLYDSKGKLVSFVKKGEVAYVDNKVNLKEFKDVYKTLDYKLIKEVGNLPKRVVPISFKVKLKVGSNLVISISDGVNSFTKEGVVVVKAIKKSVSKEDIIEKLNKLGNSVFSLEKVDIDYDEDAFVPISEINKLRRDLVLLLTRERCKNKVCYVKCKVNYDLDKEEVLSPKVVVSSLREDTIKESLGHDVMIFTKNYPLYLKYKDKGVLYETQRVANKVYDVKDDVLLEDISMIDKYKSSYSGVYLNVVNSYTVRLLRRLKVRVVGLSFENDINNILLIMKNYKERYGIEAPVMVMMYGKVELMIMKYCPINAICYKNGACNLCLKNKYEVKDRNGKFYSFLTNEGSISLLHYKPYTLYQYFDKIKSSIYISFTNENIDDVKEVLDKIS